MSTARRALDLHGQDLADLAQELAALPRGRYVLVPENELDAGLFELTPEQVAGIGHAMEQEPRGEWVDGERFFADRAARRP